VSSLKAEFVVSSGKPDTFPSDRLPEVAFLGRSNVGKSSLINALTGHKKLAFTSNTPGRTQTINFYRVDEGCYFVDLPGYGYARVPKGFTDQWKILIEQYLNNRDAHRKDTHPRKRPPRNRRKAGRRKVAPPRACSQIGRRGCAA